MSEEPRIATLEGSALDRWLNDPDPALGQLMVEFPFLRSEAQAHDFLDGIRRGVEDVRCGRTVPHDVVVRDAEERRRRRRQATAAE